MRINLDVYEKPIKGYTIKDFKEGSVKICEKIITLNIDKYPKRERLFDIEKNWYDTKPIVIINNYKGNNTEPSSLVNRTTINKDQSSHNNLFKDYTFKNSYSFIKDLYYKLWYLFNFNWNSRIYIQYFILILLFVTNIMIIINNLFIGNNLIIDHIVEIFGITSTEKNVVSPENFIEHDNNIVEDNYNKDYSLIQHKHNDKDSCNHNDSFVRSKQELVLRRKFIKKYFCMLDFTNNNKMKYYPSLFQKYTIPTVIDIPYNYKGSKVDTNIFVFIDNSSLISNDDISSNDDMSDVKSVTTAIYNPSSPKIHEYFIFNKDLYIEPGKGANNTQSIFLDNLKSEIDKTENIELSKYDIETNNIKNQIVEYKSIILENNSTIQALNNEIIKDNKTIDDIMTKSQLKDEKIKILSETVTNITENLTSIQKDLLSVNQEKNYINLELKECKNKLSNTISKLDFANKDVDMLNKQNLELEEYCASLNKKIEDYDSIYNEIDKLKDEKTPLINQIESYKNKIESLEKHIKTQHNIHIEYEIEYNKVCNELEVVRSELNEYRSR